MTAASAISPTKSSGPTKKTADERVTAAQLRTFVHPEVHLRTLAKTFLCYNSLTPLADDSKQGASAGTLLNMPGFNRKLRLLAAFAPLLMLAFATGCRGFFVNPALTSLTVAPTSVSLIQGQAQQLTATGTFDDGSTSNLTGKATWSTSASAVATVSTGGLVTAASAISNPPGTATITATSGTVTASSTITVNTGPLTAIVISTTTPNPAAGQTVVFTAMGTYSGSSQQQDITNLVTWTSSNTAVIATITNGSGAVLSTATSGSTTNVTASLNGINSSALTITVQ